MRGFHRALLLCGAVVVSLTSCDASQLLGTDAAQGIEGIVLLGPQCPVQTVDNPCPDLPYQAWISVRTGGGDTVARIQSGTDGRFRVGLVPGRYVLVPENGNPLPRAGELSVDVVPSAFVSVTINFDTGIR